MTQDKHGTLIERLNLDHEVLLGDLWDEASGNDALREAYKTIARNTQEAISHLKQSQDQAALKRLLKAAQSEPTGAEGFSDNMIAAMKNARKVI